MTTIVTLLGSIVLLFVIAWISSANRKAIRLRVVSGAFLLQLAIVAFILFVPAGRQLLLTLAAGVSNVLDYAGQGIQFLFGELTNAQYGFIFAIQVLPIIVFMSALMSLLYYLGIMQRIVRVIGGGLQALLGTSRTESMAATANIFVGNSDVFVLMRPYVRGMTDSELFALMTGGVASIAGGVMLGYAGMGINLEYLLAAAFMSAPGGLLMAKMLYPETAAVNDDAVDDKVLHQHTHSSVIEAITEGAASGLQLALGVGAMLLAFIALIALFNGMMGGLLGWFGIEGITLEWLFGHLFAPFAWLLGVPAEEILPVGNLLGQKLVLNEFVAYVNLAQIQTTLSTHTQLVTVIALAGFANLSSPAVLIGVLGAMLPEKKALIARMCPKVILAGVLANLMSASLAGLCYQLSLLL
ncbi:NupC/NupG family nucleoside CNT transporter [Alteromonas lipolytica]|uniref:Nucleoside transporter NupC n=1 Tax=Alteromonas lipolytica TaxID=1856405 RepID=A0A1E8FJA8_9ALTE|nr:nucleoside transporter C-terminal domain-containing protein [Alteromonas lipolytica]OFI36021.1 nucleoside transporter NupC [Alteromonas lipolytica]GGF71615.1 nucleoside permease [Alteromonas lipolytica]